MIASSLLKSFDSLSSKKRCLYYRRKLLEISQTVQALHMGGALSVIEILDFIYYKFIIPTLANQNPNIFLMSKGHSCIAQYILLESVGIIKKKDLDLYCKPNGKLLLSVKRGIVIEGKPRNVHIKQVSSISLFPTLGAEDAVDGTMMKSTCLNNSFILFVITGCSFEILIYVSAVIFSPFLIISSIISLILSFCLISFWK